MRALSFKRYRFPAEVIRYAVWLYFRLTLSFRDVEHTNSWLFMLDDRVWLEPGVRDVTAELAVVAAAL